MKIWFWSDTHFWHANIIHYVNRPFSNVDEMNSTIIRKFNERVKKDDLVFFLGDLGFKSGTGRGEGEPYKSQELLKQLNTSNLIFVEGNHDCFSLDTRILTPTGYKFHNEVKIGDLVATVNLKKQSIEYQPIQNILYQQHNNIYHLKNKGIDALVSNNHNHFIIPEKSIKNKQTKWIWEKQSTIDVLNKWAFWIPVAVPSKNIDYNISNDYLSLFSWIHTDGHIRFGKKQIGHIVIYQSKKENIYEIEALLKKLNIKFKHMIRNRKINKICGKPLKHINPQHEFHINSEQSQIIQKILQLDNDKFPSWINLLSDKQIHFLIFELIKGDGSYTSSNSMQLWGKKYILERWMGIFSTHNQASRIIEDKRKNYYLCIHKHIFKTIPTIKIQKKDITKINKINSVWDVTVENSIILVERNGRPFITSNSKGRNGFKTPIKSIVIEYGGCFMNLTHNPEHANFNYPINLVGHCHEKWFCKRFFNKGKFTDCINVGVDVWNFYPVSWDEINSRYIKWKKEYEKTNKI